MLECLSNREGEEGLFDPSAVHRQTLWREISYRWSWVVECVSSLHAHQGCYSALWRASLTADPYSGGEERVRRWSPPLEHPGGRDTMVY